MQVAGNYAWVTSSLFEGRDIRESLIEHDNALNQLLYDPAFSFICDGCTTRKSLAFDELTLLDEVPGKVLCSECVRAFFGRFDLNNPALVAVLTHKRPRKRKPWRTVQEWEVEQQELKEEFAYLDTVRRMSRANYRTHRAVINPKGHPLGRSGTVGAYQIDHIVPLSFCWAYRVPVEDASHVANLQVIPWSLNAVRHHHFKVRRMVR